MLRSMESVDNMKLVFMFLKPFPNNVFSTAGCVILLKEAACNREHHCHQGLDSCLDKLYV